MRIFKTTNFRSIFWTAEEFGIIGAAQYIHAHKSEESNLQLVMESDIGTFTPLGLEVTGTDLVKCVLMRVLRYENTNTPFLIVV